MVMMNSQEADVVVVIVVVVPLEMLLIAAAVPQVYDSSSFVPILFDSLLQCELWRLMRHDEWSDGRWVVLPR